MYDSQWALKPSKATLRRLLFVQRAFILSQCRLLLRTAHPLYRMTTTFYSLSPLNGH
jgi:hypothetical protein